MVSDIKCSVGIIGMHTEEEEVPDPILHVGISDDDIMKMEVQGEEVFRDHLTGQALCPELVRVARLKGLEYFESNAVWIKRPYSEARKVTGNPPITVGNSQSNQMLQNHQHGYTPFSPLSLDLSA